MVNAKLVINHLMRNDKPEKIMHSSEYARAQNGGSFGAASTESFSVRQEMGQRRKYVQGYKNSRIMNSCYGAQRAKERAGYGRYGGRGVAQENAGGQTMSAGGQTGIRRSIGNVRGEVANPMDVAIKRAQFSAGQGMESRGPAIRPLGRR